MKNQKLIHEAYKGFFNMKLHGEDVPGTGKGKGSDDLTLDDLMKMKPEPQPELPVGETPDMMFDTPYVEDEYPTSNMVKMGRVNPLFVHTVNFNVEGNKTYVYEKQKPIAAASKKTKGKKKSGGKKKRKKKTRKKKMRKKKTRKKKGGQEIKIGQEWEIKEGFNIPHENFRFIKIKRKMPAGWMVWFGKSTGDFVDGQVVVMYEHAIESRYKWIDKEADARDDPEVATGGDLEGGRRKNWGCPIQFGPMSRRSKRKSYRFNHIRTRQRIYI